MYAEYEQIKKANVMINSLCIFTNLKESSVLKKYSSLLKYLNKKEISIDKAINHYNDFVFELINNEKSISLRKYIIDRIFLDQAT